MFELIVSGGWLMIPIIGCSVLALAICLERLWELRASKIAPPDLMNNVLGWLKSGAMTAERMKEVKSGSPLGRIFVSGLQNARHGRDVMKESIQETATQVIHELERFLTALGTIASVAPLLGLLGTVIGMIKVFTEIMIQGSGNASVLAGGISEALITTASGLAVAIPTLIFHRHFQRKVDSLVVEMEQQTIKLVEVVHGERELDQDK